MMVYASLASASATGTTGTRSAACAVRPTVIRPPDGPAPLGRA